MSVVGRKNLFGLLLSMMMRRRGQWCGRHCVEGLRGADVGKDFHDQYVYRHANGYLSSSYLCEKCDTFCKTLVFNFCKFLPS
jgi:hypothetical protein